MIMSHTDCMENSEGFPYVFILELEWDQFSAQSFMSSIIVPLAVDTMIFHSDWSLKAIRLDNARCC